MDRRGHRNKSSSECKQVKTKLLALQNGARAWAKVWSSWVAFIVVILMSEVNWLIRKSSANGKESVTDGENTVR